MRVETFYEGRPTGAVTVKASSVARACVKLDVLKLWELGKGRLYDTRITLLRGDQKLDCVDGYFGMRKLELKRDGSVSYTHLDVYKRQLLARFDLNARMVRRKSAYVVYLKESDQIITLLGLMVAHEGLLRMESARVVKAVRNSANRATNCDNANRDKAINAAMRQTEAIIWLEENLGLDRLTPALEQVLSLIHI